MRYFSYCFSPRPVNENDIGRWNFRLVATDRQGQSATADLEVAVRQFPRSRLINHYFELELAFGSRPPAAHKNWEWKVIFFGLGGGRGRGM